MIAGIGTDIIRIARMQQAWDRHDARLIRRILTEREQDLMALSGDPVRYLAKRWAAKEATAKALGTGIRGGVNFHSMEVVNDALGKPDILLQAGARERLELIGGRTCWLTLSDEADYAVAFVVIAR